MLLDRLQSAANAADWKNAALLSQSLKEAVLQRRDRSLGRQTDDEVDSILRWLPADTETVVVAHQPFTLAEPNPQTLPGALEAAQGYILGLLGSIDDGKLFKNLEGRTLRFAVLAARKFANQPPNANGGTPLGMIAFQGCATYAFTPRRRNRSSPPLRKPWLWDNQPGFRK